MRSYCLVLQIFWLPRQSGSMHSVPQSNNDSDLILLEWTFLQVNIFNTLTYNHLPPLCRPIWVIWAIYNISLDIPLASPGTSWLAGFATIHKRKNSQTLSSVLHLTARHIIWYTWIMQGWKCNVFMLLFHWTVLYRDCFLLLHCVTPTFILRQFCQN